MHEKKMHIFSNDNKTKQQKQVHLKIAINIGYVFSHV